MNARTTVIALALLATPQVLAAQAAGEASATAAIEATAQAGLPESPVQRAIAEGRAKGASQAQIDRAALTTHARLLAAREALRSEARPEPTSAEIVAGADALLGGARPSDLERIRDGAPADRSLAASLTALAELTSRGEDAARAAAQIGARLAAGASDRAIASIAADGGAGSGRAGGGAAGAVEAGLTGLTGSGVGGGLPLLGGTAAVGTSVLGGLGGGL